MDGRRILHPDLSPAERRRLILRGVDEFNGGSFFAAHESWEEVWRSNRPQPRELWRGLIQVAVGMYHYQRGRPRPAARVLARGLRRLEAFRPAALGLDLEELLRCATAWERWLVEPSGGEPAAPCLAVVDPRAVR